MSVEWFFKLKEYDSLSKERINNLKAQKDQDDRLSSLNVRRQSTQEQGQELKQELLNIQQELFETEKKLKSSEQQASRLRDVGGDESKISDYLKEAATLEEQAFTLLSRIDEIEILRQENKVFLEGLERTIHEISSEVLEEKTKLEQANKILQLRLESIMNELPDNFRSLLEKTLKKNLAVGSFTRIEAGSCFFCRYKISRTEESEIDMQKQLKTCPQCSRIFLPLGA